MFVHMFVHVYVHMSAHMSVHMPVGYTSMHHTAMRDMSVHSARMHNTSIRNMPMHRKATRLCIPCLCSTSIHNTRLLARLPCTHSTMLWSMLSTVLWHTRCIACCQSMPLHMLTGIPCMHIFPVSYAAYLAGMLPDMRTCRHADKRAVRHATWARHATYYHSRCPCRQAYHSSMQFNMLSSMAADMPIHISMLSAHAVGNAVGHAVKHIIQHAIAQPATGACVKACAERHALRHAPNGMR